MKQPRVSVLMRVYNAERHLSAAIESILNQSFENFELIAVDDGSTDDSKAIILSFRNRDPRVVLIEHEVNSGLVAAANSALFAAKGEFSAIMDADDISVKNRLESQIAFLEKNPDVVLVGGHGYRIDDDSDKIQPLFAVLEDAEINLLLLREKFREGYTHLINPSVMFRTAVARKIGGYRQEFSSAEDRDFLLRIAEVGKLANLDQVVLYYRVHTGSVSVVKSSLQQEDAYRAIVEARVRRKLSPAPGSAIRWVPASPRSILDEYETLAVVAARNGNYRTSFKYSCRILAKKPLSYSAWRALLVVLLPINLVNYLRKFRS